MNTITVRNILLFILGVSRIYTFTLEQPFTLPPLPYAYNALEPYIDQETMKLHHDKHHQAYVNELNKAVADYPDLQKMKVEELVKNWKQLPKAIRQTVRNNAGGHLNHTLFWSWMAPGASGKPTGELAKVINESFGSFDAFKTKFAEKAKKVFGSGWVWLCLNQRGKLVITTTKNQNNPSSRGLYPLLGFDVWEHAYYLRYHNERSKYLDAWWHVVNWPEVARLYRLYQ
jgi:superoxide dismutase, Fe-Mn family